MEKINRGLLQFFTEHYKPGIISIVGTKHTLGMAIREAQRVFYKNLCNRFGIGVIRGWSEWRPGEPSVFPLSIYQFATSCRHFDQDTAKSCVTIKTTAGANPISVW